MQIKVKQGQIQEGETYFRRKRSKDIKKVHEGGTMHLERIYASGGMIVSVFHNYLTNRQEEKYDSIKTAIEKYKYMSDMRKNTPEWVDEGLMPAILKATRAAQRQAAQGRNISIELGDPLPEDIERECGEITAMVAAARKADPELDEEMTRAEMEHERLSRK